MKRYTLFKYYRYFKKEVLFPLFLMLTISVISQSLYWWMEYELTILEKIICINLSLLSFTLCLYVLYKKQRQYYMKKNSIKLQLNSHEKNIKLINSTVYN